MKDQEGRVLKSLLKKPGQARSKGSKNRVVINEKMNEFFAADYIILIKEECCADYEEECDCCCQEHEMIRLGNCKECRAELNLRFGEAGGLTGPDDECDEDDEDEDEEEEEEDEEEDEEQPAVRPEEPKSRRHQQRETLSPPEGYKDLCVAAQAQQELEDGEDAVCVECDCYQRQAAEAASANNIDETSTVSNPARVEDETWRNASQDSTEETAQSAIDQTQQKTPDVQQRFLVETITMTTVTERRIVREISQEEPRSSIDEADTTGGTTGERQPSLEHQKSTDSTDSKSVLVNGEISLTPSKSDDSSEKEKPSDLSLAFKSLGSVSSLVSNSLKPNSAVRQLFPDPRFISPPPAPMKYVSSDLEDADESGDNQKFLITTESLRLFDAVKRSKIAAGSRSDSSESDSSIKRTIERNALRRSLICKYESGGTLKKKNLRSKDLTLEERIRQLTCVDEDEDAADSSASENNNTGRINSQNNNNNNNLNNNVNGVTGRTIGEGNEDQNALPTRTSPSGEERPKGHVVQSHSGHHHHHHGNSAYKKITDLFAQKKNQPELNLPDIGLGSKQMSMKPSVPAKMNTEARKQFLASFAPLSCVASSGVDGREDYYRIPSKMTGDRSSVCYNSDSSYSLEDIEDALNEGIPAPPDVTRGTPTSAGPSVDPDATDELLAFIEQDRSRIERIKRRYDVEDHQRNNEIEIPKNTGVVLPTEDEDEDDEHNDYGFNRRPSVRGIKAQFETTNEIVRQLRTRSAAANSLPEACRLNFATQDEVASASSDVYRVTYTNEIQADPNTINRINSMQRQINDIYQSIADGGALLDQQRAQPGSYMSLPRTTIPQSEGACRYPDHKNGLQTGTLLNPARMLRIAGGGDVANANPVYSTLPKAHRHPQMTGYSAGYSCGVVPANASPGARCYKTMYFVPYNGLSDPTYQNIQRILPPHSSSTNYAEHIERYPYPRNGRIDPQQQRYYVRPATIPNTQSTSGALHLHLHQTEEFQVSAAQSAARSQTLPHGTVVHPMQPQLQQVHQQQQQQLASTYNVQTLSGVTYSICPPPPPSQSTATYTYQMQIQGRLSASDMQTQTSNSPNTQMTSSLLATGNLPAVLNSGNSSLLSSPTKLQAQPYQQAQGSLQRSVAERGVPEGAASAPAHDYAIVTQQTSDQGLLATTTQTTANLAASFVPNDNGPGAPILDPQNPVYYAMNV